MHLNYHFLKFLCPQLQELVKGMQVYECFTQNKDELVIGLSDGERQQYIRANLAPANTCLSFPEDFKRSKKNNVSLFPDLITDKVEEVAVLEFERAFVLRFSSGQVLLFKLHGSRSNILLYPQEEDLPSKIFRNELKEDKELRITALRNPLALDWNRFSDLEGNASQFLPTLGKVPRQWLKDRGYIDASLERKWQLMQEVMDMLEHPLYAIVQEGGQYILTLLPVENSILTTDDPIVAANEFFKYVVVIQSFEKEKNVLLRKLEEAKKKTQSYLDKTAAKLLELERETSPSQLADIIMANLHQIPRGAEQVSLYDFYRDEQIEVSIKRGMSPQKHAENLYRKGKNRKIEIGQLQKNLEDKENYLLGLETMLEEVAGIRHFKELRAFEKENNLISASKEQQEAISYKRFEVDGFEVLVGKSSKANDELLRRYAWKEDLWLHAKDVSGSHVIVKYQSGQRIPNPTIERAAELAAYYSKNKTESLAAVIYTPCKYVRKVKGSAPGAVMVDKESVIMVKPRGPERQLDQ
jgi:predicted ribosome quality control (RQC) complex YloA/Tae2 family protein